MLESQFRCLHLYQDWRNLLVITPFDWNARFYPSLSINALASHPSSKTMDHDGKITEGNGRDASRGDAEMQGLSTRRSENGGAEQK